MQAQRRWSVQDLCTAIPEQGQLGQSHLEPGLPRAGVAAEDVQGHGEAVQHLDAPGGLQLFLEKEAVSEATSSGATAKGQAGHCPLVLCPCPPRREGPLAPSPPMEIIMQGPGTLVGAAILSMFKKTAVTPGIPLIFSEERGPVRCTPHWPPWAAHPVDGCALVTNSLGMSAVGDRGENPGPPSGVGPTCTWTTHGPVWMMHLRSRVTRHLPGLTALTARLENDVGTAWAMDGGIPCSTLLGGVLGLASPSSTALTAPRGPV